MKLILGAMMVTLTAPVTVSHPPPLAAWAIAVEQDGHFSMKAVVLQLDATHAVVGTKGETNGLDASSGSQEMKAMKLIPVPDLYKLGTDAPLKRGIVIVCGAPKDDTTL